MHTRKSLFAIISFKSRFGWWNQGNQPMFQSRLGCSVLQFWTAGANDSGYVFGQRESRNLGTTWEQTLPNTVQNCHA
jgi:hypothetical protein